MRTLRVVIALCVVGAAALTIPSGHVPPLWVGVGIVVLAVSFAVWPDSLAGTCALAAVVAWWALALRSGLTPWCMPAAGLILMAHVAGAIAAYGPAGLAIEPVLARLWVRRSTVVALVIPFSYAAALALRSAPDFSLVWPTAMLAVTAALVAAATLVSRR